MYDVLTRHGQVYDRSGNPWLHADVAIAGDVPRILRGDTTRVEARRTIDARGRVVCPGFIDMHAHSANVILSYPLHEPKVRQDITPDLIGVDGNSYAPSLKRADLAHLITLNASLDGRPPSGLNARSVGEYLEHFDGKGDG
jgi:N-acyl-D-amino-acid deacylase